MRTDIRFIVVLLAVTVLVTLMLSTLGTGGVALAVEEEAGTTPAQPVPAHWAFSKLMWAAVALVFSVMGTAWAQSKIGMAGAGAMAEKPELAGTIIILVAIPETMVILGFVIAAMLIFS